MTYVTLEQWANRNNTIEERLTALEQRHATAQAAAEQYGMELHLQNGHYLIAVTPASSAFRTGPNHLGTEDASRGN